MIGTKEYIGNFKFRIEGIENDIGRLWEYIKNIEADNRELEGMVKALVKYLDLELVKPSVGSTDWSCSYRAQVKEKK